MFPQIPDKEKLLTTSEAKTLLQISSRTLRRYAAAGKLREVRLSSRTFRYPLSDVRQLMITTQGGAQ
ncbi:helix-turn-helix domain-containing protein [Salmonella enterica subsp. enterica]|uniref:Helix-turn-helix domain-containing protein n=1 Tax=Salmonella enterica I TaxID=59201 RepID=A0A3U1SEM0_SALET|nr:helix-turn-helix domain-containing protein [Salmonella enterica]EAA8258252.1 helix-turn-helix domain-containing protein [Salmonella enterica subsp. enterica]EAA9401466.1 helix-turn-helix domain-containing protein [Salmonella enterica subsp. enterica serovar 4,5,12:b:-]EBQ9391891.1 hypothetical protein [Salmonella enterica subsp. enterica serovar Javiana]EBS4936835.1 hypothetical protein [Salmonella enterica subsp. enterica serovar Goverdhan]EBV5391663.1 hypothetical protein [Salmonella ente